MDWKLELVAVPVSDVDRAKAFYVEQAGFNADHDHPVSDELRFVQLTPPGSACSIAIGTGLTERDAGSAGPPDRRRRRRRGAGRARRPGSTSARSRSSWGSFVFFATPTATAGAVQQLPPEVCGGRLRPQGRLRGRR